MNDYKVVWMDDCGETHEEIIRAKDSASAEMQVFSENDNCMNIEGAVRL